MVAPGVLLSRVTLWAVAKFPGAGVATGCAAAPLMTYSATVMSESTNASLIAKILMVEELEIVSAPV